MKTYSTTIVWPTSAATAAADCFDEAVKYDKDRAAWAVNAIAKLYKIEKDIREAGFPLTESQIVEKRMREALPILTQLKEWMHQECPKVLPGSPIGKAMAYALPLMDNMKYYTLHGELQIDRAADCNNLIENAIRPVALGRKKRIVAPCLFASTHDTAQNAAMIYSLFATCKKHETARRCGQSPRMAPGCVPEIERPQLRGQVL